MPSDEEIQVMLKVGTAMLENTEMATGGLAKTQSGKKIMTDFY